MKNPFSKKVFAFIVSATIFSASAYAQIVYTDINPDVSVTRTRLNQRGSVSIEHSMDVNNDGISDLKFTLLSRNVSGFGPGSNSTATGSVSATPLNGSAILSGGSGDPAKMTLNQSINTSANWSTGTQQVLISEVKSTPVQVNPVPPPPTITRKGNWNTTTDGFLGLRFVAAGQTRYCWIRLNAAAFSSGATAATLVLKDFAFNSSPNAGILAGQTIAPTPPISTASAATSSAATSIDEHLAPFFSLSLYPNPAVDKFILDLGNTNQKVVLTIFDLKGKMVYSTSETEAQRIDVNTSNFEKGMYLVKIQSADFTATKRLVISK